MVPPPGYYYRPARIQLETLGEGWKLFRTEWKAWTLALVLWGLVVLAVTAGALVVAGLWSMFAYAFAHDFDPAAANPDGSWRPYPNLWCEAGMYVVSGVLMTAIWVVSLAGLGRMALRQIRGEPISAFDSFAIGGRLLPLLGMTAATAIPIAVSSNCVLPAFVLMGLWMFAPMACVDERLGAIRSLRRSFELASPNWVMAALFVFVASLYAATGAVVCLVGVIPTSAVAVIALALVYERCRTTYVPIPADATPGAWPPPPFEGVSDWHSGPPPNEDN